MDVLRKELNEIYTRQHLESERLDEEFVSDGIVAVKAAVTISGQCAVITDASKDRSWFITGAFGRMLGLPGRECPQCRSIPSSDEDFIYTRMHPEDLVDKRLLEYEFFKFVEAAPLSDKQKYKAVCRIRIRSGDGSYIRVDNSTQLLRLSPAGKIWLILCCYDLSACQTTHTGIDSKIINNETGEIIPLSLAENRRTILSAREQEILLMIRQGKLSKEIAAELNISINTVNRHRQNILQKLSVGNSIEAVNAAIAMNLI